jgi:hypothetical protein
VRLIDPPYNTGSAFTHYDDGLEHSIWLGLMRDRLEIIRRLLSDDGSLCISPTRRGRTRDGYFSAPELARIRQRTLKTDYVAITWAEIALGENGVIGAKCLKNGGRTWARTKDPLIKSLDRAVLAWVGVGCHK